MLLFGISSMLYLYPELKAVNEQADDEIMHLDGLREADRLAHQAFDPGAQRQMFALQLLGLVFPHFMERGIEMALIRAPAIGVKTGDPKRNQQRFQLQERLIFPSPKHVG